MTVKQRFHTLQFMKCTPGCGDDCYYPNRHYPEHGTSGMQGRDGETILRINVLVGPTSIAHRWASSEDVRTPEGYRSFTSERESGAEDWQRYWWFTGRMPPLAPGDIIQEVYFKRHPGSGPLIRNFLVVEDCGDGLRLHGIDGIPASTKTILEEALRS